ncbi:hypothetical protein V8B97DRAFT_979362 [Scleroderma yunnanense]
MLEAFSRTVRNYVPSSIPIPSAAPSPPRVSRPVSFGSFNVFPVASNPLLGRNPWDSSSASERCQRVSSVTQITSATSAVYEGSVEAESPMFGSEDEDIVASPPVDARFTAYPTVGEGDPILWSRWDRLMHSDSTRRVLFLGYPTGFQVWDCTNLASVSEIVNLSDPSWGRVTFAGVFVPPPLADDGQLKGLRPLIGVISQVRGESFMVIYSLRSHQMVKRLPFRKVSSFTSGSRFIVISTTNPPTLHILSSASLTILHTITSSSILSSTRTSSHKSNTNNQQTVLLSDIDAHGSDESTKDDFIPIYSLSHRLLAFAAQPPRLDAAHGSGPAAQLRARARSSSRTFGISQADLGSTAARVGGTVLHGMKSLGGMAFSAAAEYAKSRVTAPSPSSAPGKAEQPFTPGGLSSLFFSRSAPPASGDHDPSNVRGTALGSRWRDESPSQEEVITGNTDNWWALRRSAGAYVRVLDLAPLLDRKAAAPPEPVAEFIATKHQPISHLRFTHDGTSLLVAPKDGQVIRMFQIRPTPRIVRGIEPRTPTVVVTGSSTESISSSAGDGAPWHLYNLRRGRTSAVIEGIEISPDGKWVAIGTGKRTVHIFAVNPYGGQPDPRSHTDMRIWNADKPQPLSTELNPIARLRSTKSAAVDGVHSDLSFIFVSDDVNLSGGLLPPPSAIASSPSTSSARSDLGPPPYQSRVRNYRDVLIFDSSRGVLSLRRITLEQRPHDPGISIPIANLATSISLPGTGAGGRLGTSTYPNKNGRSASGLTQQLLETSIELVGRESTVATWQLKRRHDWGEVRLVMCEPAEKERAPASECDFSFLVRCRVISKVHLHSSLAHAELSTFSHQPEIVPRSVYLSHQFFFYTLGEDYHALIRRHHLAITGDKIEVRREVEPSTYASGAGAGATGRGINEVFIAGTHGGPDLNRVASSLDEPLASAMTSGLDPPPAAPNIPMFPNGGRGRPHSFGAALPIRSLKEGVGGGLDKLRREMYRVRSPKRELEHEGMIDQIGTGGEGNSPGSRVSGISGVSLQTPSAHGTPEEADAMGGIGGRNLDEGESEGESQTMWQGWGWGEEDKRAIDEAEQFDDVLGFMDEDQAPAVQMAQRRE